MPSQQSLLSAQAAFAQHLFIQGYPLWNPSPDLLPVDRQSDGLSIGDVGVVDEQGQFDVLFNIFEPLPGSGGSPPNLPPIEVANTRRTGDDLMPRDVVCSPATEWHVEQVNGLSSFHTATATQYSATLSVDGAHIILPRGAQLFELRPSHQQLFENYAKQHGKDWLELFRDRLESSRSDSLYILTGFYKTSSWSIASFSMQRAANADPVYVRCTLVEVDERTIQEESIWQPTGRFQRKTGPPTDLQGRNNQTVFVRGITVTPAMSKSGRNKQEVGGLLERFFSSALFLGPSVGDSNKPTATEAPTDDVIIGHVPKTSRAPHPSEIVNHYLLMKDPSAKIAVTCDTQWMTMLKSAEGGESWTVKDLADHLEALVPTSYSIVTHNDTVSLREKDKIHVGDDLSRLINDRRIPDNPTLADGRVTPDGRPNKSNDFNSFANVSISRLSRGWDSNVTQGSHGTIGSNNDTAMRSNDLKEVVAQYSAALSLAPPNRAQLLVGRSKALAMLGLWEDALMDADEVIKVEPMYPCGYERRHAALHGLQRHGEAADAFTRTLSLLQGLLGPDIRQIGEKYVSPAHSEMLIDNIVRGVFEICPLVLIDVKSGHLCDRAERMNIFKSEPQFKKLISSMTRALDEGHILREVAKYFRFVMLSHVWQEKEPSFRDVKLTNSVWNLDLSPPNDKLRRFCEIVQSDGYRWAWSDTCCIDKTDSTVLNQSLKMMYKWYQESAATLVLLVDVSSPSFPGDLTNSIWMTRSWTAQELLAPKVIRFYDRNWRPYIDNTHPNHKEAPEILQELAKAINLSPKNIVMFNPDHLSVREKLRLASTRNATIDEDIAYSLIGVFKSNIQPHYGEGYVALGHLLEEVMARSGDTTVLAWTGRSSPYNSCLPASLSAYGQVPFASLAIEGAKVETHAAALRASLSREQAIPIYYRITHLPSVRFANRRLHLPCIKFNVEKLNKRDFGGGRESHYRALVPGIRGYVEFKTSDRLSLTEPHKVIFVHPWIHALRDPPDGLTWGNAPGDASPAATMDDYTRALRLVVRLQQPFHALLLQQQSNGVFKRVAAEHEIIIPGVEPLVNFARDIRAGVVEIS